MKIVRPLETFRNLKNAIFLAGPCPRKDYDNDWRNDMIVELKKVKFNGDVITPTNPKYDTKDPDYYNKQCTWETRGMHVASTILFWIDRNSENPGFTTNIEFGIWSAKMPQSLVVGIPKGSKKCDYIKWVCKTKDIPCFETMEEVAEFIKEKYARKPKTFFTSDTHFGSDRHIELSKRPFRNIEEMDYTFISNWNKTVFADDTVFHLGDFGNPKTISLINVGKLYLLEGNYERDDNDFNIDDSRVTILNKYCDIKINDETIRCVHEPISEIGEEDENIKFYLFGHIHEKGLVKRNGLNVGIDAHNYFPIDVNTVKFYKNAIEKYYDDNVFFIYFK